MRAKPCKECGRVGHWHTYCSDACKQRHWRKEQDKKLQGEIKAVDSWLRDDLPEDAVVSINKLLNKVPSKKYAKFINDAMEILITSYHTEIRKAKTGRR